MARQVRPELSLKTALLLCVTVVVAGALSLSIVSLSSKPSDSADETATLAAQQTPDQVVEVIVEVTVPLIDSATGLPDADPAAGAATTGGSSLTATPVANRTAAPTTAAPTQPAPTQPAPTTQAPTTTQAPEVVAPEYLYYSFSGLASTIVIANHGGSSLEFWSATAEPGWVYSVEKGTGSEITLKFFQPSNGSEGRFTAKLEGAKVKIERES